MAMLNNQMVAHRKIQMTLPLCSALQFTWSGDTQAQLRRFPSFLCGSIYVFADPYLYFKESFTCAPYLLCGTLWQFNIAIENGHL
jgi:hypothetical protein